MDSLETANAAATLCAGVSTTTWATYQVMLMSHVAERSGPVLRERSGVTAYDVDTVANEASLAAWVGVVGVAGGAGAGGATIEPEQLVALAACRLLEKTRVIARAQGRLNAQYSRLCQCEQGLHVCRKKIKRHGPQ